MTHFVSGLWPPRFGPVKTLRKTLLCSTFGANAASPYTAVTDGTEDEDWISYTVPVGGSGGGDGSGTGLYLAIAAFHMQVVSDSSTTQTIECNVAYNNGVAVTTTSLGELASGGMTGSTFAPVDCKTANKHSSQFGFFRAEAGTDITMAVEVATGADAATSGSVDVDFVIMRVG